MESQVANPVRGRFLLLLACALMVMAAARHTVTIRDSVVMLGFVRELRQGPDTSGTAPQALESLLRRESSDLSAVAYRLGLWYLALGDHDSAVSWFSQVEGGDQAVGWLQYQLGLDAYREGDLSGAIASWLQAGAVAPLLDLAEELQEGGDWQRSLEAYEAVIALEPENSRAHYGAGEILAGQRDWENALVHLERAAVAAEHIWAYIRLGDAYEQFAEYEKALQMYRKASKMEPNSEWPSIWIGRLMVLRYENPADALPALEQAILANPGNAVGHYWLARAAMGVGDWDRTVAELQNAVVLDPGTHSYHFGLYEEAPDLWLAAGEQLLARADKDAAELFLCQLILHRPGSEAADKARTILQREGMGDNCDAESRRPGGLPTGTRPC